MYGICKGWDPYLLCDANSPDLWPDPSHPGVGHLPGMTEEKLRSTVHGPRLFNKVSRIASVLPTHLEASASPFCFSVKGTASLYT